MNKSIILKIAQSITVTLTVAAVFAFVCYSFVGNFLPWFLFFNIVQFLGFYFLGEFFKNKNNKLVIDTQIKEIEIKNQQSVDVICPCDMAIRTRVPIKLDRENTYTCGKCRKDIIVLIAAKTALMTSPVPTNILEESHVVESVNRLIDKQNGNN